MSGKQNNNTTDGKTFTNPCFPNMIFKKFNGKDIVVSMQDTSQEEAAKPILKIATKLPAK